MLVRDAMHPRVVTADPNETLPEAVVKMQELHVKRLPVMHGGRLVGILTDGEVRQHLPTLDEGLTPWAFAGRAGRVHVREAMRIPVFTVLATEPLDRAMTVMLDRRVGGLPVLDDDGQLCGMLTLTDVLRASTHAARLEWGTVEQHMTTAVVSVPVTAPAADGAARLTVSRLHVLPVLDGQILVGLLHERDVTQAVGRAQAIHGKTLMGAQFLLDGRTVRDLMRAPSGVLRESTPLHDALTRMLELDVHGLPVIDLDGTLLGVVTISDVLRAMLRREPHPS